LLQDPAYNHTGRVSLTYGIEKIYKKVKKAYRKDLINISLGAQEKFKNCG
jgi:hypothetical protein